MLQRASGSCADTVSPAGSCVIAAAMLCLQTPDRWCSGHSHELMKRGFAVLTSKLHVTAYLTLHALAALITVAVHSRASSSTETSLTRLVLTMSRALQQHSALSVQGTPRKWLCHASRRAHGIVGAAHLMMNDFVLSSLHISCWTACVSCCTLLMASAITCSHVQTVANHKRIEATQWLGTCSKGCKSTSACCEAGRCNMNSSI